MKTTINIQGNLAWLWCRTKTGNYLAICNPLAQTVQADTFRELLETMDEALNSTLNELFSTGDLNKFLHERGWSFMTPIPPQQRNVRFEMPFDVKGSSKRDFSEALCK
jgi:hypothetical protein